MKADGIKTSDDPRKVVVHSLAMEVAGRPDVVLDVSTPAAIEALKDKVIIIKEGVEYRLKVRFNVQNDGTFSFATLFICSIIYLLYDCFTLFVFS